MTIIINAKRNVIIILIRNIIGTSQTRQRRVIECILYAHFQVLTVIPAVYTYLICKLCVHLYDVRVRAFSPYIRAFRKNDDIRVHFRGAACAMCTRIV